MPDMYYPVAYDPYMEANFEYWPERADKSSNVGLFYSNNNTSLWPVEGAVPRTDEQMILPWELRNTLDDYNRSKLMVTSPLDPSKKAANLERGQKLYDQNCAVCHGTAGDAQGSIVKSNAYTGVPTYAERELSVGSVYHVIMYGRNAMGSYAPQLNEVDRWRVAEYVMEKFKDVRVASSYGSQTTAPVVMNLPTDPMDENTENTNQ